MKLKIKLIVLISFFAITAQSADVLCPKGSTIVKSHYVNQYIRRNGVWVSGYYRKQYCRDLGDYLGEVEFKNSTLKKLSLEVKFKEWTDGEVEEVLKNLIALPEILKSLELRDFYRSELGDTKQNPATILIKDRSLVLYDRYFKEKNRKQIISHELAHMLYWKLSDDQKKEFAKIAGWKIEQDKLKRVKIKKAIYEDSVLSPGEDFANCVEAYYFDRKKMINLDPNLEKYFTKVLDKR